MKKEVKQSAKHFDDMDLIDRAQQDAIEAIASRVEALVWTMCVVLLVFGSTLLFLVADHFK